MTKTTLPQADDGCQKLVLDVMRAMAVPLTAAQICAVVRTAHKYSNADVRGAIHALDELGDIDSDTGPGARLPVFFIAGSPPSLCVVTPAHEAPPLGLPARTWFSDLGVAA